MIRLKKSFQFLKSMTICLVLVFRRVTPKIDLSKKIREKIVRNDNI
jgi:hypothetical protein